MDCPGHASLIRTIIGGAQIIDMMILVIDITKGIQTQTAEVYSDFSISFSLIHFITIYYCFIVGSAYARLIVFYLVYSHRRDNMQ